MNEPEPYPGHLAHAVAGLAEVKPAEPDPCVGPEFSGRPLEQHVAALHSAKLPLTKLSFDPKSSFAELH